MLCCRIQLNRCEEGAAHGAGMAGIAFPSAHTMLTGSKCCSPPLHLTQGEPPLQLAGRQEELVHVGIPSVLGHHLDAVSNKEGGILGAHLQPRSRGRGQQHAGSESGGGCLGILGAGALFAAGAARPTLRQGCAPPAPPSPRRDSSRKPRPWPGARTLAAPRSRKCCC